MARAARWIFLLCVLFLSLPFLASAQSNITYVYDDLGRLVAVIDPSGDTARYYYDAVGNLLSITRASSSQVSVLYFSPAKGPVGTQVTIYGTSFSTTPSQNTVQFNGIAATVVSSTATQIVATVPSSATTGAISVTAPAGSATSATSFTVTADAGQPTISNVSPVVGAAGTAVTITGTNFDTAPASNKPKFNIFASVVSAATTTSLSTSVPTNATSGRIYLTTPAGSATSSQDFFVPPSPYTASDVVYTNRMSLGAATASITIGTAGKIGLIVFDATAGQRLSLHAFNSGMNGVDIYVYTPGGSTFASTVAYTSTAGFIEPQALPATGTYMIMIDPRTTLTGSLTLGIYDVVDWVGITSWGGSHSFSLGTPGQNANIQWGASSGNQVSFLISGNSIAGSTGVLITNPDGSVLNPLVYASSSSTFVDQKSVIGNGTATVNVNPSYANTGNLTVTVYNATDVIGTISPGGAPQTVTLSVPGQNAKLTFSGTAGQRVSLKTDNITIPNLGGSATISILNPDGSTLVSQGVYTPNTWLVEPVTLPTTGTYTVFVDGVSQNIGNATETLYEVNDITGTIPTNGSPVTASITTPGQNARYTFSGTTNQRVSLNITGVTFSTATVAIQKPDGSTLTSVTVGTSGGGTAKFIEPQTLPTTGTYTVLVDPAGVGTGNATLALYDVPADVTGTITPGGSPVTVTITTPGQNGSLTFSGTAGQEISLRITSVTISNSNVTIKKPDGTNLVSNPSVSTGGAFFDAVTLSATGTYTISIDPANAFTGSMTLTLYDVVDLAGTITPGGSAVTVPITVLGQNASYTFSGTQDQLISLRMTSVTIASSTVTIKKPDGTNLSTLTVGTGGGFIDRTSLPTTGTYTILVDPATTNTGNMTLTLYDVADVTGSITVNGSALPVTISYPGQQAAITFSGTASQLVTVRVTGNTSSTITVKLMKPDGTQQATTTSSAASFNMAQQTLATAGTYTIIIDPNSTNSGSLNISVTNP